MWTAFLATWSSWRFAPRRTHMEVETVRDRATAFCAALDAATSSVPPST